MTTIEHDLTIAIFQQVHAVDGAQSSSLYAALPFGGRLIVYRLHDRRIVVAIVP